MNRTTRTILIAGVGIVLLLVVYVLLRHTFTPAAVPVEPGTTFPISSSSPQGTGAVPISVVGLANGGSITTKDFIHNGTTIEDPANAGDYYLSGGSGACKPDGTCPTAGNSSDFNIVYFAQQGSFVIGLNKEPLGDVRKEAEQYLMNALGLNQAQMCMLDYSIGTTVYVNATYGSIDNLKFSFCPDATKLP